MTRRHALSCSPFVICSLLLLLLLLSTFQPPQASGSEIEATDEWQLLQEGDTVPAGMHIRIDMTTGERWAKKAQTEDGNDDADNKESNSGRKVEGDTRALALPDANVISGVTTTETTINSNADDTRQENQDGIAYDYIAMHKTFSKLPPEELLELNSDNNSTSSSGLPELPKTEQDKASFEAKMHRLWTLRQEKLQRLQDQLADMPDVLRVHIDALKQSLQLLQTIHAGEDAAVGVSWSKYAQAQDTALRTLLELEYHLSDIDMTRDFHTLGGWTLLLSFLAPPPIPSVDTAIWANMAEQHLQQEDNQLSHNDTASESQTITGETMHQTAMQKRIQLQTAAAWAVGTAVKNTAEFAPFAVEPMATSIDNHENATAISLVLDLLAEWNTNPTCGPHTTDDDEAETCPTPPTAIVPQQLKLISAMHQKALYALGALLRGNPMGQRYFVIDLASSSDAAKDVLSGVLTRALDSNGSSGSRSLDQVKQDIKLASKLLSLAHDLIVESTSATPKKDDTDTNMDKDTDTDANIDADTDRDTDTTRNENDADTKQKLVQALTEAPWCQSLDQLLHIRYHHLPNDSAGLESTLQLIKVMLPHCLQTPKTSCASWWHVDQVKRKELVQSVKEGWEEEVDEDVLDAEWRVELMGLAEEVLELLKEAEEKCGVA